MRTPNRSTTLLGVIALCGCVDFDPSLYQNASGLTLADRCEDIANVPVIPAALHQVVAVDTTRLRDQYREFTSCVGRDLPGNDGFFAVRMRPGETWHFHVDPLSPTADPAIYVLPVCTTLQCSSAGASDACGVGRGEHFSFRPVTEGVHLIGIDSRVAGGERYSLTIVRPVCGNGSIEHGEPCDDARPQSGVICEKCHKVLSTPMASEAGVANDDYVNAMVLRPAAGGLAGFPVTGALSGCDADMFSFDAAAGNTIRAALTPRDGGQCPAGLSLSLLRSDPVTPPALTAAPTRVPEATTTTANGCPTLTLSRVPVTSTWFLEVTIRPSSATEFAYQLTVDARR